MKNRKNRALWKVAAAALALVLVAASCGSDDDEVSITMARANWDSGYFQASLYRQMLQRLGYEVSDPAEKELGPSLAYLAMAEDDIDFWVNSWYPGHNSWLEPELPDGSKVGDHVSAIGEQMVAGGLQGLLVTKSFAEKHNLRTLDDLNNNPEALAEYDSGDTNPNDGIADIYGCPEDWTCDDILESQIAFSGWENIKQVLAGYEAMFAEATSRLADDEPVVIYTWAPSGYIAQLRPGDNVMWIGVEEVIDNSNPLEREGGEEWDQRPGLASLDSDTCLNIVEGGCQLGWVPANILVTARNDLLENNPSLKRLFELVKLNVVDVVSHVIEQKNTNADPDDLAARWIEENSALVDGWIAEARAAA